MTEDLHVLGGPPRGPGDPVRVHDPRIPPIVVLLVIGVGSVALGVKRDPLLTWLIWGVIACAWAGSALTRGRVSVAGAASMFASLGLVGAGLSLVAYGMSHCIAGGFSVTADGRRFGDFCSARQTVPVYIATGFVIALAGTASVRSVWRLGKPIAFLQAFTPIAAFILLFDVGYLGFFAAPVTVPALVMLARKSGSRLYKSVCYLNAALTLARVGLLVAYPLSH